MHRALVIVILAACDAPPRLGAERAACSGSSTCDPGLACLSDRCVRLPGADCAVVGEKLVSFELGNYAPREQRAPLLARRRGECEAAHLSQTDGACILAAPDKDKLALCPRPLIVAAVPRSTGEIPAGCAAYIAALERYGTCDKLDAEARTSLRKAAVTMRREYARAFGTVAASAVEPASATCRQGEDALRQAWRQQGCAGSF